jgi:hypothetical protein
MSFGQGQRDKIKMNLYSDFELLDANFRLLAIENERKRAAVDVKMHVEAAARELSLERFGKFENELYMKIFNCLSGNSLEEKTGGVIAIKELIECTSASAETKVKNFAHNLSILLKSNTDFALIELIAVTLGHMARNSPVAHVDFIEGELIRALEWLKAEQPHRKFAACVVLQQLAANALSACLSVLRQRTYHLEWYCHIYDHIHEGLKRG